MGRCELDSCGSGQGPVTRRALKIVVKNLKVNRLLKISGIPKRSNA